MAHVVHCTPYGSCRMLCLFLSTFSCFPCCAVICLIAFSPNGKIDRAVRIDGAPSYSSTYKALMMSAPWLKTLCRWIHHTKESSCPMTRLLQILLSFTGNSINVYLLTLLTFCLYRRCTNLPDVADRDIPDFHDDWKDTDQMRRMEDDRSSWWWAPFCQWAKTEWSPHDDVHYIYYRNLLENYRCSYHCF